jgi:hypothetical protein
VTTLSPETKLGNVGEAMLAGKLRAQAKRLRELEAGKATASPPDPLAGLERREKARAERHMGSVVRRLHRQGRLADGQLHALETWAADYAASSVGVRSQLGRDGSAGGRDGTGSPAHAAELALSRYRTARAALYLACHVPLDPDSTAPARVTEAVACRNASLTAAVTSELGKSKGGRSSAEGLDMVRLGADALERHYRGMGR